MNITLYYAPISCALVPYITLTEANAEFDVRTINLRQKEHLQPEYKKVNPKQKVPLLVVDGRNLSENPAMQLWIDSQFPEARILPADPWEKAQAVSILSWCSAGVHPYISIVNTPSKICSLDETADNVSQLAQAFVKKGFALAEDMLEGREYFFDHFTAADAHYFWCFRRCTFFDMDLSKFKNSQAHFERMKTRPSVQKLIAFEEQTMAGFLQSA